MLLLVDKGYFKEKSLFSQIITKLTNENSDLSMAILLYVGEVLQVADGKEDTEYSQIVTVL